MKVDAIQSIDGTKAQGATSVAGKGEDFSSYLQVPTSLEDIFEEAAQTYHVPKSLIKAIAKTESDFNPNATSKAGAQGIMQLMPATARELGVEDSYDPYQNIMGGTKYISQMLEQYDGDVTLALAAYNAGSNNVAKYGGVPPFKETQNYVVKVTKYMQEGVETPNTAYTVEKSNQTDSIHTDPVRAASLEEAEDNIYQDILDQIFSYEEYLRFIDLYTKLQEAQQEKEKEEQEQQKEKSDAYYNYQAIRYSPAVMNLLGGSN